MTLDAFSAALVAACAVGGSALGAWRSGALIRRQLKRVRRRLDAVEGRVSEHDVLLAHAAARRGLTRR